MLEGCFVCFAAFMLSPGSPKPRLEPPPASDPPPDLAACRARSRAPTPPVPAPGIRKSGLPDRPHTREPRPRPLAFKPRNPGPFPPGVREPRCTFHSPDPDACCCVRENTERQVAPARGVGTRPPASAAHPPPRPAPAPVGPPAAAPPDPPRTPRRGERGTPRSALPAPVPLGPSSRPFSRSQAGLLAPAPRGEGRGCPRAGGVELAASSLDLGTHPAPEHSCAETPGEKSLGSGWGSGPS